MDNFMSFPISPKYTILVLKPLSWEETNKAIDALKAGMVLLLNLTMLESSSVSRVAEYTAGSASALLAHHVRVDDGVFLIAPRQFKISTQT